MTRIRMAAYQDAERIAALLHQLGYARSMADIAQQLAVRDERAAILLAVNEDDDAVGCLQVMVDNRLAEGRRGEIVSLVVAAEMRGRGIGAALVAAAARWLREHGIAGMRVRCNAVRDRAHHFYERLGFGLTKTQKVFDVSVDAASQRSAPV